MELVIKLNADEEARMFDRLTNGLPMYDVQTLDPYLTIGEVCGIAKISKTTFYDVVKKELGVVKIGGKTLVDSKDFVAYMNSNKEW